MGIDMFAVGEDDVLLDKAFSDAGLHSNFRHCQVANWELGLHNSPRCCPSLSGLGRFFRQNAGSKNVKTKERILSDIPY